MSQKHNLTLRMNSSKFLLTIAYTILPLTSASHIVRKVRTTKSPVRTTRYRASLVFQEGTTIRISFLILSRNTLSTFPLPP